MIDLTTYGYIQDQPAPDGLLPGRVIEQHGALYAVVTERGEVTASVTGAYQFAAQERGDYPCVGDFVSVQYNEAGDSRITGLLPRRSAFSRADFSGHAAGYAKTVLEQVVAANFDYVFILSSLNRDFRVNRIVRYLTQTLRSGGTPVVILTKSDLTDDASPYIGQVREAAPDVSIHAVSSYTGDGIGDLGAYLRPWKTVVFLGMSGVGKSSLLNALAGEDLMTVRETRSEDVSKGSHTTTHRQLFMLPSGAMVIDTPGMRELGLFDADEAVSAGFTDVEDFISACRFSDCRHASEPGCAVLAALEDGSLPHARWERYLAQRREIRFVENRSAYMRGKRDFQKSIATHTKHEKKMGRIKR